MRYINLRLLTYLLMGRLLFSYLDFQHFQKATPCLQTFRL